MIRRAVLFLAVAAAVCLAQHSNPLTLPSPLLPPATVGQPYSHQLAVTGGHTPYHFYQSGPLPPGLVFDEGLISGTPLTAGRYQFYVSVYDGAQSSVSGDFVLEVRPAAAAPPQITTQALANAMLGQPYSQTVQATGGTPPYIWSTEAPLAALRRAASLDPTLPPGVTIAAATGAISGTPTRGGLFRFGVRVTDAKQVASVKTLSILVVVPALTITTQSLPGGVRNAEYAATLAAQGGQPPYNWSIPTGTLPAGLTLGDGGITGRPSAAGTFPFTAQVTDASGQRASRPFEIVVTAPPLAITTPALSAGTTGLSYSAELAAAGGAGPYQWSCEGTLPPGLTLDGASGAITGTPVTPGDYPITVRVVDADGNAASHSYSIRVAPPPLRIETGSAGSATAGSAFSLDLAATGGTPPYQWSVSSGSLPAGLSLDAATGKVSGSPSQAGAFAFTAQVTDAAGGASTHDYSITVGVPAVPAAIEVTDAEAGRQAHAIVAVTQYPLRLTGRLTLTFTPETGLPDDPAIQFASGGRTFDFTMEIGGTGVPAPFQVGTTAGTIAIQVSFTAGGVDVPPLAPLSRSVRIERRAPALLSGTARRTSGGLEVVLTGFATGREVTSATYRFTGTNLQSSDFTVQAGSAFTAWFNDAASQAFGGQFKYTQPFTVQGDTNTIQSVTVTLTNAQGGSQSLPLNF